MTYLTCVEQKKLYSTYTDEYILYTQYRGIYCTVVLYTVHINFIHCQCTLSVLQSEIVQYM
jgi:hypothetical protein